MPEPINLLTTPGVVATDVMQACSDNPLKMIAIGFFCGLMVEAAVYLAGGAYDALVAYRDAIKAA